MSFDRIDGIGGPSRPDGTGPSGSARGRTPETPATETGDRIELSERARLVSSLAERVDALPEERAEKVEAIRTELQNGTYEVDSRQLARAIVEFEDDLSG